jgi:hypothetical protein
MNFLDRMREILQNEKLDTGTAQVHPIVDGGFASGRIDLGTDSLVPSSGSRIEWESPLFGHLVGEVIETNSSTITAWHPLTDKLVTIPLEWIKRISSETQGNTKR